MGAQETSVVARIPWSFAFGNLGQWLSTFQYSDHKKFNVETDSTVTPDPGR